LILSRAPKTQLLFVIRDFTSQTPIEKLGATMLGYLSKIWASLNKPPGKESSTIDEFFDFDFVGLPHKIFARDAFESEVSKLRTRFVDKSYPTHLFKAIYHKHIPADGFPHFAGGIWTKIVTNRDLDLPTQTQLLAQHRCEEISKEVFEEFSERVGGLKGPLRDGVVLETFGSEANEAVEQGLGMYAHIF
jgi:hypothetical protein